MNELLTVYLIANGFVITCPAEEEFIEPDTFAYEVDNCKSKEGLTKVTQLLYDILNVMGCDGSKHDEYRIEIKVKKQHKEVS